MGFAYGALQYKGKDCTPVVRAKNLELESKLDVYTLQY